MTAGRLRTRAKPPAMEALLSVILRAGLLLSLALLGAGMVWRWWSTGQVQFDYALPRTNAVQFMWDELRQVLSGALRPRLLVNLGLVALLLTPYARVLTSMVYFAVVERNAKYTVFTGIVLLSLTCTLFLR